ncbi:MAG: hypothetical protein LQ351_006078 [Letrouitia transgressa]|nr:MAG: hypothetical protein LQ351_006078 [Letrouitia transgressa]
MASEELSPSQAHALFDILTHHEAYAEIEGLKKTYNVANFGTPVSSDTPSTLSSPLIQILLNGFVFVLPGLRDVSVEFWSRNVQAIITAMDDSNLSESYDKGAVGIRRTLSSAIAASIEFAARGCLGGYARRSVDRNRDYDTSKPEDVAAAWDDFLQEIIYGDLLDELFKKAAETDKLSDHESLVQAAHKYGVAMLEPQSIAAAAMSNALLLTA